jgi:hypothetical protein
VFRISQGQQDCEARYEIGEIVLLFDPRLQIWYDNLTGMAANNGIVGVTSVGRATAVTLNFNQSSLVLAWQAWVSVGRLPPED